MRQFILPLLALPVIISAVLFAKGDEVTMISYEALTKARMDSLVVANVGPIAITAKEFLLGIEYGPAFARRGKDAPMRYLQLLINEKLLTLDGLANGLASTARVSETVAEIEGDLATEELFKDDVLSEVDVSDAEIAAAVAQEKMHLALKWLYARTPYELQRLQGRLNAGAVFDSLVLTQISDSVAIEDRSLESTKFNLEGKNPHLSSVVDTLKFGAVSSPVPGPDGWYLVKITDAWQNAITSETENMTMRQKVQRALYKRKMDVLSDQYIQQMMRENAPVIERKTFNPLLVYIGKQILTEEAFLSWDLTSQALAEFGPFDIAQIKVFEDQPLVRMRHDVIPLKAFMTWYGTRENNIRLRHATPQQFFLSLQQAVWQMVQDYLLVQRANQRGLPNRGIVKTQKQWWQEKIVQAAVKSQLSASIQLDEASLRAYYQAHIRDYRKTGGEVIPYEAAKSDVQRDFFAQEYTRKLFRRIQQLRQQYPVEVYETVLTGLESRYPISADPKAIDVFVVKKGGTFPRPAFPTIDMDWKGWY